jgi:hypothetical protein
MFLSLNIKEDLQHVKLAPLQWNEVRLSKKSKVICVWGAGALC